MARRTPEQKVADLMKKFKDMGVTISVTPALGAPDSPVRSAHIIAEAAKAAGIYYEQENN